MANRLDRPQRSTTGASTPGATHRSSISMAFQGLAARVQDLGKASATAWSPGDVMDLLKRARAALDEATRGAGGDNPYAQLQAMEAARAQARQLVLTLNPPPEIFESAEFHALLDLLAPRRRAGGDARADAKPLLRGKVRSDVLNRQVQDAVAKADQHALHKRVSEPQRAAGDAMATGGRSLMHLARVLKRRRKKKKSGATSEVTDSVEVTREEAEELATLALEVMRALREEFAPRWQPQQQPWFVNAADNEVYSIVLGVLPKELFEQTQAYASMQNLRAGDGVFQFRAGDKTADALKRG